MLKPAHQISQLALAPCAARAYSLDTMGSFGMQNDGTGAALSPQAANSAGMDALRKQDFQAAILAFERATQLDPNAPPLWCNLAHAHRLAGNVEAEGAALDRALSLNQLDFGAQLRKAQWLQRTGKETAALIAWNGVQQLVAGQSLEISPGVQAELDEGAAYCRKLQARLGTTAERIVAEGSAGWDETERRRIGAFVDRALGRRTIFHNECAGLHYPFLPEDEYFDRRHFPWFSELEAHTDVIRSEFLGIMNEPGEAIRPYVRIEEGAPENKWSKLDGSLDWGACFLWEYGEPNGPIHERCPKTVALLSRLPLLTIPGRGPSAFFSILRPRSHIPAHTGVTNTRAIIHLPLIVPEGCRFRVGNETRHWIEGQAFAFDDTIDHEAWNDSDQFRAILIIDAWNPHLSAQERKAVSDYIREADLALT